MTGNSDTVIEALRKSFEFFRRLADRECRDSADKRGVAVVYSALLSRGRGSLGIDAFRLEKRLELPCNRVASETTRQP